MASRLTNANATTLLGRNLVHSNVSTDNLSSSGCLHESGTVGKSKTLQKAASQRLPVLKNIMHVPDYQPGSLSLGA